jgi:transposase
MKDLVRDAGILLLYLPPYSPDYNPIEELFSYAKYYLKEHDEVAQPLGDITLILNGRSQDFRIEGARGKELRANFFELEATPTN